MPRLKLVIATAAVIAGIGLQNAWAGDMKLTLPKRSQLTPVQRLNREGVDAVRKQQFEKAEAIFYKAYLYDPGDPFTLYNLGYVSEMQGQLDRAQKFYKLALQQGADDAFIDRSNARELEGRSMKDAFEGLKDAPMRINQMNVEAVRLLADNRNAEADTLLQQALALDPENPFTLNNLGVAKEAVGDYENALKYYDEAAGTHSSEPVVITLTHAWRGKPVSEMAADSAGQLEKRLQSMGNIGARVTMLALRGVSATNQNNWDAAKQDFLQAYALDPNNAFSLNNLGYIAEKDGDLETAKFYYSRAGKAKDADARVGLATQHSAEGQHLFAVATDSDHKVGGELDQYGQIRRQQTGPIELIPRGDLSVESNGPAKDPSSADAPSSPIAEPSVSQPPR